MSRNQHEYAVEDVVDMQRWENALTAARNALSCDALAPERKAAQRALRSLADETENLIYQIAAAR